MGYGLLVVCLVFTCVLYAVWLVCAGMHLISGQNSIHWGGMRAAAGLVVGLVVGQGVVGLDVCTLGLVVGLVVGDEDLVGLVLGAYVESSSHPAFHTHHSEKTFVDSSHLPH